MSFYIKPKFKIGQKIFSIKADNIISITVESIAISTCGKVSYLSNNQMFLENQSFSSKEEALEFISSAYRIPFRTNEFAWIGNLAGVVRTQAKDGMFWFKEDKATPYNSQIHAENCLNDTSCFETQLQATEFSLRQLKQFNERTKPTSTNQS